MHGHEGLTETNCGEQDSDMDSKIHHTWGTLAEILQVISSDTLAGLIN